ncbi:MAG: hypothetical protein GY938_03215 [Ketobacter sp.]|nr:hypothetical protein [Ketobacter sp.]
MLRLFDSRGTSRINSFNRIQRDQMNMPLGNYQTVTVIHREPITNHKAVFVMVQYEFMIPTFCNLTKKGMLKP